MSQYLIGVAFVIGIVAAFAVTESLVLAVPAGFVTAVIWYVSPAPNHTMPGVSGKGEYWGINPGEGQ